MKKLLALLVALMMLLSIVPSMAEDELPLSDYVILLYTSDVHGGVLSTDDQLGYGGISAAKYNLQSLGATVILMDNGDAIQGDPVVNLGYGANAVDLMNQAGYDIAAPGNHEFDWGVANLQEILQKAEYSFVCANVVYEESGESVFDPSVIVELDNGILIGVFGILTPETATKTHPDKIKGLKFLAGEEMFACAQAQVDSLKEQGCQLIVCLGHLGTDDESTGNRSIDLLDNVTGIDLFVDGHSHDVMDGADVSQGTIRVAVGTKSQCIGYTAYLTGTAEDGTATLTLADCGTYWAYDIIGSAIATGCVPTMDADVQEYVNQVYAEVQETLGAPFATTEVTLNGNRDPGNRTEETNLGDFACDAILWAAREATGQNVVAAISNGGGIRATIPAGEISMLDLKTVFPFGNSVAVLTVTGAELLEALEAGTFTTPTALGAFPQVSGIEYTIDTTVEWVAGEQYPGSTYYAPANPGSRVTITSVGGEAFDPDAEYIIATNDFTAAGGDTYYAFKRGFAESGINTQLVLEDALVNYVSEVLGGVIGQEYAEPQGRITIIQ